MTKSWSISLFILASICSCSDNQPNKLRPEKTADIYSEKHSGISIENGSRQGFKDFDSLGTEYFYLYKTTTINNNNTFPIDLKISFSKEYEDLRSNSGLKSKVLLLPTELTSEKDLNDLSMEELKKFLDTSIDAPVILNKALSPKGKYTILFGILTDTKYKVPFYFGLKFKTNTFQDSITQNETKNGKSLILPIVLYLDNPYVISCGQISLHE
ncbi:MAG: hypothetical protein JNJ40_03710 [Bacteroidia bacterium]|nr:hypothetical protein [Bacteroidia bacterium]